jgi:hypothetical protein
MKMPAAKHWMRLVFCYWLFILEIVYLEMRNMSSDWAGLPGFLVTLPLSLLVVAGELCSRISWLQLTRH